MSCSTASARTATAARSRCSGPADCRAYGYTASVQPQRRLLTLLMKMARVYLWRSLLSWLPGGKRIRIYSINLMRARHPAWFRKDLGRLFRAIGDWRHPAARRRADLFR